MDFTKIPRELIYKERNSLEEFGIFEENSFNSYLAETIRKFDFIKEGGNSELKALKCMNDAYYICTMSELEKDSRWRLNDYEVIAKSNWTKDAVFFQGLTMMLVYIYLRQLFLSYPNKECLLIDELDDIMLNNERFKYIFYKLKDSLPNKVNIPIDEFKPRIVNDVTLLETRQSNLSSHFYTNYFKESIIRSIVYNLGKTKWEKIKLIDFFDEEARIYYNESQYYKEEVNPMLMNFKNEIEENPSIVHILPIITGGKKFDLISGIRGVDPSEKQNQKELAKDENRNLEIKFNKSEEKVKQLSSELEQIKEENKKLKEEQMLAENPIKQSIIEEKDAEIIKYKQMYEEYHAKYISFYDNVFDDKINVDTVADAIKRISYASLSGKPYWYVVFTVLSEIHWIPNPHKSRKKFLQWVCARFDLEWKSEYDFKFADIDKRIAKTRSEEWNEETMTTSQGQYYGELAKIVRETFVETVNNGKLIDKSAFIKPGQTRINNGH